MRFGGIAILLCLCACAAVAADVKDQLAWRTQSASDPRGLIGHARKLLDAGALAQDPAGERELLWWMGHAAVSASDDVAHTEAVSRLDSLGSARKDAMATAYAGFLRADRKIERGDPSGVSEALQAAAHLHDDVDPGKRALMQFQVCDAYTMAGDAEHALPICREAEAAFRALGDEWNLAQAENNEGANLVNLDRPEAAAKVYEQARQRYFAVNDRSQALMVGDNLARVYIGLGRAREALDLSRASLADEQASGRVADALLSRANIARALNALGQNRQALDEIADTVTQARMAQRNGLLPDLLDSQSRLAEANGDLKLALAAARESDRMQQTQRVPRIEAAEAELSARYAAREKELRIRDLERENQLQELELKSTQAESQHRAEIVERSRLSLAVTLVTALALAAVVLLLWLLLRAQRRHADELRAQTLRDPLTGVENRRGFFERLHALLQTPRSAAALPHVLMLVDLDHFKRINDGFGHPFGDMVLSDVVDCMRGVVGVQGTLARLGGEEFAVLCPRIGADPALRLAEKMRAEIAKLNFLQRQESIAVTISIGVAVFDGARSHDADSWLRNADAALYSAKEHGRDRVVASVALR